MIWELLAILNNPDAIEITRDSNRELVIREIRDEPIDAGARRLDALTMVNALEEPHEVAA